MISRGWLHVPVSLVLLAEYNSVKTNQSPDPSIQNERVIRYILYYEYIQYKYTIGVFFPIFDNFPSTINFPTTKLSTYYRKQSYLT